MANPSFPVPDFYSKIERMNIPHELNSNKEQITILEENIDKNEFKEYASEHVIESKKPELEGSGKMCVDRQRCGNPSLSPPLIFGKGKLVESGYIMLQRAAEELFEKDLDAFLLLTQIAFRARRENSPFDRKLTKNQAFVGDYKSCHLTRQRYRDAKDRIERVYGLATFKGTNKGTIATIIDSRVYDINSCDREPPKKPTRNQQGTTNKECNNKNTHIHSYSSLSLDLLNFFIEALKKSRPEVTRFPGPDQAKHFETLLKSHSAATIKAVITYALGDEDFWRSKISTPQNLVKGTKEHPDRMATLLSRMACDNLAKNNAKGPSDRRTKNIDGTPVTSQHDGRW